MFWPWSADPAVTATLEGLRGRVQPETEVMVLDRGLGFAAAVNQAARSRAHADLAIVADACTLPESWLERVHRAAYIDDTVAAATALATGDGRAPFAGFDGDPVLGGKSAVTESGSRSDAGTSAGPVHPRLFTLWPHCAVVRASAIELLGPFEESIAHPMAVLAEFAARALARGLSCALADDVQVDRLGGGLPPCPDAELAKVADLHPWIVAVRAEEDALELGPLRRSLVAARVAGARLSVTVDARALGPTSAGTQTYVAGVVLALARSQRVAVRAVVRDDAPHSVADDFKRAGVEVVTESRAADGLGRTDIAHRPQQAFVPEDLSLLRRVGERVVITHLDLISYRNPAYHDSAEEWQRSAA